MNILDLTPNQLKRAAAIKEQIDRLNAELQAILGVQADSRSNKNRGMSAAVKRKIAAAQKARWANVRRGNGPARKARSSTGAGKNTKSPATRAKLSARMKAYWAAKKAGKETAAKSKKA